MIRYHTRQTEAFRVLEVGSSVFSRALGLGNAKSWVKGSVCRICINKRGAKPQPGTLKPPIPKTPIAYTYPKP